MHSKHLTQLQAPLDDHKKEEMRKDSSLAKDLANQSGGQRVMLATALHLANMQQPGLTLWDPALTAGWAKPSSTRDAALLVTSWQTAFFAARSGSGRTGSTALRGSGECAWAPWAGVLSRAARKLRGQSSQQDRSSRAARGLTHSDAHPWVGPWHPRRGAVGEATACSWGSAVGLQHGGLADWVRSPQPEVLPGEMGSNRGY